MEGDSGVTRSIIDGLESSDTAGDALKVESGVTRSSIYEIHSSDVEGAQI